MIESFLEERSRRWVRDLRRLEQVTSTNDVLKEAAREGAPEGTVAVAVGQTAGRGRQGRRWVSPPGNLFLSMLLRPDDRASLSLIPLAAGLAVAEAFEAAGAPDTRLKWPNDVLVCGRKLAGILAEASTGASGVESIVLGAGANVNLRRDELPEELRDVVTSLYEETHRVSDVEELAAKVLDRWVAWYDALKVDRRTVRDAWRARSVDWWGRPVEVTSGGVRQAGVARDIDDAGALILERSDGACVAIVSGEARELRAAQ